MMGLPDPVGCDHRFVMHMVECQSGMFAVPVCERCGMTLPARYSEGIL